MNTNGTHNYRTEVVTGDVTLAKTRYWIERLREEGGDDESLESIISFSKMLQREQEECLLH